MVWVARSMGIRDPVDLGPQEATVVGDVGASAGGQGQPVGPVARLATTRTATPAVDLDHRAPIDVDREDGAVVADAGSLGEAEPVGQHVELERGVDGGAHDGHGVLAMSRG